MCALTDETILSDFLEIEYYGWSKFYEFPSNQQLDFHCTKCTWFLAQFLPPLSANLEWPMLYEWQQILFRNYN